MSGYVRTDSGGGGEKSQDNPTGGGECDLFLVQCFWATAFFLAGNRMTIVAFEKEVSLKSISLSLFSETIVRQYCSFKLEEKTSNIYKWKEKVQKNTGRRRKVQVTKAASKDFIALFSSRWRACLVLKHNRVSEVFKGFKVHDFEYYGQRNYILKWKFNLCH